MQIARHVEQIQPSYIREILSAATAPNVISLAGGLPDGDSFPLALMEEAINGLSSQSSLFQYGETAGYQPLLDFVRPYYQLSELQDAVVCTGSQQGLDLIARAFINPGDGVAMEAPSYLGALQVFALAQAAIETVAQGPEGPDLEQLETCFASGKIKLFYAVPDFHNPTGVCWSLEVRQQVAALCVQYGVALVEDAPYRALRFDGAELPMVSSFCPQLSLVLRSFSKIATPGIRLGLLSCPKEWLAPLIKVKQSADLHSSSPMQAVLLALLQHPGMADHLAGLRKLYRQRYDTLAAALVEKLPANCSFEPVQGGMFVWLKLAAAEPLVVAKACLEQGVAVVPSTVFYKQGGEMESALRLNFSNATQSELQLAVARLAQVLAAQ